MVALPELLAPAGDLLKLRFALEYGADAVYVGAEGFSMRPRSASIAAEELQQALELTHGQGKKLYVAINTLLFQRDLAALERWLEQTRELAFDALIISDPGALALAGRLRPELPLHISTQLSTANAEAAAFWKQAGASRVILARECTLADAEAIAQRSEIGVEIFVHGAMCVAISGRCLLSAHLSRYSASKGECKQTCRWEWQLVEQKRPGEALPVFEEGGKTIFLGSTDLCLIRRIPTLVKAGLAALKIEGRMKSAYHVAAVTRAYRAALDAFAADPDRYSLDQRWLEELDAVSHRAYAEGFADGYPGRAPQSLQTFNRPLSTRDVVGWVLASRDGRHTVEVKNPFARGETLEWIGPGTAGGQLTIDAITSEGEAIARSISATTVEVSLQGEATGLGPYCILRRQRRSD